MYDMKRIMGLAILLLTVALQGQQKQETAWGSSVALINKHRNQIKAYEGNNFDQPVDSLRLLSSKDPEQVRLELFYTSMEHREGMEEPVLTVMGGYWSILDLRKVEMDQEKREVLLEFQEEVPKNTSGERVQLHLFLEDPKAAYATAAAFKHLWNMVEKYHEQKRNAGTCDF